MPNHIVPAKKSLIGVKIRLCGAVGLSMGILALICTGVAAPAAYANEGSDRKAAEIAYLLHYLANADCRFYRNGQWYRAAEAVEHIDRKYRYLHRKGLIDSAEQFIERAAAQSSMTGIPYQVQCGAAEPVRSSVWLQNALKQYRQDSDPPQ